MLQVKYSTSAFSTGCLICLGVFFNGLLAARIPSVTASCAIHVLGCVAGCVAWIFTAKHNYPKAHFRPKWWAYCAGIFGALSVTCMGMAVNSTLGISGATIVMMLGQLLYSVSSDGLGWFSTTKRALTGWDFLQIALIFFGAILLIY